jgi:hypothetical protein
MPRWARVVRGMIGIGLTFAAGVGVLASLTGALVWLGNGISGRTAIEIVAKVTVASFPLGLAFSAILAITARGRRFSKLLLGAVGGLGAGAGLLYFLFLAANGGSRWSLPDAIANVVSLTVMGSGAAMATLAIARRTAPTLDPVQELPSLEAPAADSIS